MELSNLYITKEDLVEVFCNKFKAEIPKAQDLAGEHSALVPTDVSAVIHSPKYKPFGVDKAVTIRGSIIKLG